MKILFAWLLLFTTVFVYGQDNASDKLNTPQLIILGHIDKIYSNELGEERTLNIYLPEGYRQADTVKYPVIYLLDGGTDEDFIHIVGLVQYNSFEWVNRIPKSIVVGIATVDRRRDFTFPSTVQSEKTSFPTSGQSGKFISFIEKELQPYIEKKYKTSSNRTIIGQSLGGLLATQILLKRPTIFNQYIIISPSLWWDNGSILSQEPDILNESFIQQTKIYIGVGKEGLTPTKTPRVMEVDANLLAEKLSATKSKHLKVFFDYLPDENHATIMHQAVLNAFKKLS